jgi:hypothetical protein
MNHGNQRRYCVHRAEPVVRWRIVTHRVWWAPWRKRVYLLCEGCDST